MGNPLREIREAIQQNGLVPPAILSEFVERHRTFLQQASHKEIGERLVKSGLLTRWQARFVVQGKSDLLTLGNYVLLERLGDGGMGIVFKARHRTMDRVVAIKTLNPEIARRKNTIARFRREVKAAARLVDPNIVTAFDAGHERDIHFLVMEYVDGRDLGAIIKENGPIPYRHAAELILQAARGLQHAHQQGLVHRDVKPGNLLLDRSGTVKVLDLGLARLTAGDNQADGDEAQMTQAGQVMGTMDFMAPEQAENMSSVDGRADIYSLGCTLYYLINGQTIYPTKSAISKLLAHREQPVPPLGNDDRPVPASFDAIYRRMVAKEPSERFASMRDVVAELTSALQTEDQRTSGTRTTPAIAAQKLVAAAQQTQSETPAFSELSELKGSDGSMNLDGSSEMTLPWTATQRHGVSAAHWITLTLAACVVGGAIMLIKPPEESPEFSRSAGTSQSRQREPRIFHTSSAPSNASTESVQTGEESTASEETPREKAPQAENSFSL
jgi:serine/threonine protein kinase